MFPPSSRHPAAPVARTLKLDKMNTIKDQIKQSNHISKISGHPAQIKAAGKIWFLAGGMGYHYECRNPRPEWNGSQFLLKGNKSFTPYWAMSVAGIQAVKEAAAKIGRTRHIKNWA